jgi:hypothetical protein
LVKYIDKEALKEKYKLSGKNNFYIWFAQLWKIYRNSLDAMPVMIDKIQIFCF